MKITKTMLKKVAEGANRDQRKLMQKYEKLIKLKRKLCSACHQRKLFYKNGLPISKYCSFCKKQKELEKKAKHLITKGAQKSLRKRLHKKAWGLISEFVRRSAAKLTNSSKDALRCYTCGKLVYWKNAHCSHFHHNKLDFDAARNLRACCVACNAYRGGNLAAYATNLAKELGVEGLQQLRLDANTKGNNYSIEELEGIIELYKSKLYEMDKTKN